MSISVGGVQGRQQGTILIVLSHKETATLNSISKAAGETQTPVRPQPCVPCAGSPSVPRSCPVPHLSYSMKINMAGWLISFLECIFNFFLFGCLDGWAYNWKDGVDEWIKR